MSRSNGITKVLKEGITEKKVDLLNNLHEEVSRALDIAARP